MRRRDFLKAILTGTAAAALGVAPRQVGATPHPDCIKHLNAKAGAWCNRYQCTCPDCHVSFRDIMREMREQMRTAEYQPPVILMSRNQYDLYVAATKTGES